MDRITYESARKGKSDGILKDHQTLVTLLKRGIIRQLDIRVPDISMSDLDSPNMIEQEQKFRLFSVPKNGAVLDLKSMLQKATEPSLKDNLFTQAQIADLIENHWMVMIDCFSLEIFAMFRIEKDGVPRDLVAVINCFGKESNCRIFGINEKAIWGAANVDRAIVIKTNR